MKGLRTSRILRAAVKASTLRAKVSLLHGFNPRRLSASRLRVILFYFLGGGGGGFEKKNILTVFCDLNLPAFQFTLKSRKQMTWITKSFFFAVVFLKFVCKSDKLVYPHFDQVHRDSLDTPPFYPSPRPLPSSP